MLQVFSVVRIHAKTKKDQYLVEWEGYSGAERFSAVGVSDLSIGLVADFESRFDWPLRVGDMIDVRMSKKSSTHRVAWIGGLQDIRKNPRPAPPITLDPPILGLSWMTAIRVLNSKRAFRPVCLWELSND